MKEKERVREKITFARGKREMGSAENEIRGRR